MMNLLLQAVQAVNSCLSDYVLTVLLVGTGLFFTIRTRLVQRYCLGKGMRQALGDFSLHGRQNGHGLNPFQALCAAVAAHLPRPLADDCAIQALYVQEAGETMV